MFLDDPKADYIAMLKGMSSKEIELFAVELREKLIDSVSKTGGHLASNLGVVELTLALHKVFDSPKDKIIWDVGHQSYVHKMLTGRMDQFDTLRQLGGISGFPKIDESEHDMYSSGHSGTSISAAMGYAKARDLKGESYSCIAVIGDGSLTSGVAYEALDSAGTDTTPLIVILNDNQRSISSSKGGMASHLTDLRTSKRYTEFKSNIKNAADKHPGIYKKLQGARDTIKNAIMPSGIFEELGFKYYGPIDGHNVEDLVKSLEYAKNLKRPVLLHVVTKKGKGFVPAEKNSAKFHGVGKFNPSTVSSESERNENSYSEIFGEALYNLAKENDKIAAVSAAMTFATGLSEMKTEFPDRVFDAGIAEQHAVSFAAGLALNGMRPVVAIYSTFLQRAYDQILTEVCLQNLPVVFAIDRAGITGRDGETHQGAFDISYLSAMPNMTVLAPKDGEELKEMLAYAFTLNGPCAIRYPRADNTDLTYGNRETFGPFAERVTGDGDYAIIAVGNEVKDCIAAAGILRADGYATAVYNLRVIKPLQIDFLNHIKNKYKKIVVAEDGIITGGAGSEIARFMSEEKYTAPVLCLGWPDRFIEHGGIDELKEKYGLDVKSIAAKCEEFFEK